MQGTEAYVTGVKFNEDETIVYLRDDTRPGWVGMAVLDTYHEQRLGEEIGRRVGYGTTPFKAAVEAINGDAELECHVYQLTH